MDIFQRLLCTPNEWEALKLIDKHGDEACLAQDELLQKLVSLVGDDLIDDEKGSKIGVLKRKMTAAREAPTSKKIIVAALAENEERFKQILKIQQINHNLITEGFSKQDGNQQTVISKLDKLASRILLNVFERLISI